MLITRCFLPIQIELKGKDSYLFQNLVSGDLHAERMGKRSEGIRVGRKQEAAQGQAINSLRAVTEKLRPEW